MTVRYGSPLHPSGGMRYGSPIWAALMPAPVISLVSDLTPNYLGSVTITVANVSASGNSVTIGGVAQTITGSSLSGGAGTITFTVVRGNNRYGSDLALIVADQYGNQSAPTTVQLAPQAGWDFVTITTPDATATNRLTTTGGGDLAAGDVIAWNTQSGAVTVSASGLWDAVSTVASFQAECWTPVDGWGATATQTVNDPAPAADTTAPVFSTALLAQAITATGFQITGASNEAGVASLIVTSQSASQPSNAAFDASLTTANITAGAAFSFSKADAVESTGYRAWVQIKDSASTPNRTTAFVDVATSAAGGGGSGGGAVVVIPAGGAGITNRGYGCSGELSEDGESIPVPHDGGEVEIFISGNFDGASVSLQVLLAGVGFVDEPGFPVTAGTRQHIKMTRATMIKVVVTNAGVNTRIAYSLITTPR